MTNGSTFPVGIRQYKVIQHVRKALAANGDREFRQMREVGSAHLASMMFLCEIHFLCWSFCRPPVLDLALQCAQLSVGETLWLLPLQGGKDGLCFQLRVHPQPLLHTRPPLLETRPAPPANAAPSSSHSAAASPAHTSARSLHPSPPYRRLS